MRTTFVAVYWRGCAPRARGCSTRNSQADAQHPKWAPPLSALQITGRCYRPICMLVLVYSEKQWHRCSPSCGQAQVISRASHRAEPGRPTTSIRGRQNKGSNCGAHLRSRVGLAGGETHGRRVPLLAVAVRTCPHPPSQAAMPSSRESRARGGGVQVFQGHFPVQAQVLVSANDVMRGGAVRCLLAPSALLRQAGRCLATRK